MKNGANLSTSKRLAARDTLQPTICCPCRLHRVCVAAEDDCAAGGAAAAAEPCPDVWCVLAGALCPSTCSLHALDGVAESQCPSIFEYVCHSWPECGPYRTQSIHLHELSTQMMQPAALGQIAAVYLSCDAGTCAMHTLATIYTQTESFFGCSKEISREVFCRNQLACCRLRSVRPSDGRRWTPVRAGGCGGGVWRGDRAAGQRVDAKPV